MSLSRKESGERRVQCREEPEILRERDSVNYAKDFFGELEVNVSVR